MSIEKYCGNCGIRLGHMGQRRPKGISVLEWLHAKSKLCDRIRESTGAKFSFENDGWDATCWRPKGTLFTWGHEEAHER